jgi:GAF domain-containing protein/anti-sigma regulatory factor (Ser/Thr protein kinase)
MGSVERPPAVIGYARRADRNAQYLCETSALLSTSLDEHLLAQRVARASLDLFCDVCAVYLFGADGALERTALAAIDTKLCQKADTALASAASSRQGFIHEVIRSGQSRVFADAVAADNLIYESAARVLHASGAHSMILAPVLVGSVASGAIAFLKADGTVPYDDLDARCAHAVARQFSLALENAQLRERGRRAEARSALLRDATDRLFTTPDETQMLAELLNVVVQEFADRAVAVVLSEKRLQPIASAGSGDKAAGIFHEELERRIIQAIRGQRPIQENPAYADAWMMSPLFIAGRAYGAVLCYSSARHYDTEDLQTLQELCQRTSLALEYANSFARERRLAQTLQRATLPPSLAAVPGAITSVVYRPASEEEQVGGDWYDLFSLGDDRILVTIGDVTGHGLPAWSIMSKLRHTINVVAKYEKSPARILDAVEPVVQQRYPDAIATAFVAIVDMRRRTLTYATAGHPPPMLRRNDSSISRLSAEGLPIGLRNLAASTAKSATAQLDGIDLLVFYTDGLTEATRNIIDGERWLVHALRSDAVLVTCDSADFIKNSCLRGPLPDDVAVLALNFKSMDRWRFASHDERSAQTARREFCDRLRQKWSNAAECAAAELIFGELLSNVVRHAPGPVEMALEWRGERAVLHVLDRGRGYHAENMTRADVLSENGRGLWLISKMGGLLEFEPLPGFGMHTRVVLPGPDPGNWNEV